MMMYPGGGAAPRSAQKMARAAAGARASMVTVKFISVIARVRELLRQRRMTAVALEVVTPTSPALDWIAILGQQGHQGRHITLLQLREGLKHNSPVVCSTPQCRQARHRRSRRSRRKRWPGLMLLQTRPKSRQRHKKLRRRPRQILSPCRPRTPNNPKLR